MANKFEQDQLNQLTEGRGVFSAFWKKLTSSRLKKQLKKMEDDPYMRDALRKLNRSIDDFERQLEINAKMNSSIDDKDMDKEEKELAKFYRSLGVKW